MKSNRIIWGLVALVVLITIAVSFGTRGSYSQQGASKEQDNNAYEDLSKYAVADYNAPEPKNAIERGERILKNKRYDNQHWVVKNPHPDTDGVGLIDEIPPLPIIPIAESNLIIIGEIVSASAYLSNDKQGIYTEFVVRIEEILKDNISNKVNQGDSITADRAGGFVRYPNGQKVLYRITQNDLPQVGCEYVLFIRTDKQSPNYEILTGHKFKDGSVSPLDTKQRFDDFKGTNKLNFIEAIRNKISKSSQPVKN